ncbi:MAG: hypothetical protein HPY74_04100 [Firmicutes bacterium]|nr:hypothetical protein [Bacillota bacterium]
MQYIKKLPLILSMFMSIIIGIAGYMQGVAQKEIYIRIVISLVLFFALGLFIKNNIEKIYGSILEKKNTYDAETGEKK